MVEKNTEILLKSFAEEIGWVRFQIDSFNAFVERRLQKVIDEIGQIEPEVPEIGELVIKLGKVTVGDPSVREADGTVRKIMPAEARLRDLTYAAPIHVEMTPVVNKVEQEGVPVMIGELPVMIKSATCPLSKMTRQQLPEYGEDQDDPGGYFIVNSTERALILIEEIAPNRMIVQKQDAGNYRETIRINSEREGYTQRHLIERKVDGSIVISFANIRRLPVVILLKALGTETDKEIMEGLQADPETINAFMGNLYETEVTDSKSALGVIASNMRIVEKEFESTRIERIIDRYLLPHLGQDAKSRKAKAAYLCAAITKIVGFSLGKIPEDDIDHFANKRVRLSGDLLELLFRSILVGRWGLITRIKYNYQKMAKRGKLPPIQTIVESNVVSQQLVSAMSTGAWTGGRTGVSQRLDRANLTKTFSHLRMVLSPLTSTQEHFEARELHPTNWGRFCPAETPEGPTIGLRKHLALMAEVTPGLNEADKEKLVKNLKLSSAPGEGKYRVLIDGTPSGWGSRDIIEDIRKKRRGDLISRQINTVFLPHGEIRINTDAGRVRRPLLVVENGRHRLTQEMLDKIAGRQMKWSDLLKSGVIEFIDADEEDAALVALKESDLRQEHTHLELTPLIILGLSAALLPFAQHNRGDRVNFGAKMIGQSIGLYQSNFLRRADTKSNILVYSQTPLIETAAVPLTSMLTHPAGENVIIAVAPFHGYNMEDAVIFNKSSVERGMFRSFFYRIYSAEERRYWGGQEDKVAIPEKDVRGYKAEADYARLNEDGILPPESPVVGGDVVIGKISPMRFLSATELMGGIANMRDTSVQLRPSERGIVDRVFMTETVHGNKLIKVAVRDLRIPEPGDKFASRHGQKSVVGMIADEEDLPFSAAGYIPDIMINPHAVPSRQTLGQLLEMLAGKTAALNGSKMDATPFASLPESDIRAMLGSMGFRSDGKEIMYNGLTGEKFEAEIFIGINYYQKLDHMVANKLQTRSRGPVTLLTRQPTEGKAKEGGLRLGEMEKDCLIAHGAVLTLKERFDSDKITIPICRTHGITALWDKAKGTNVCPLDKDTDVVDVDMSYAFKLLLDELKTMGIWPKLKIGG
ncbi:MAG: DNA-directed RNA polymerase subunit B'' [Candidatus Aenigmatarchaeota archaeon]